MSQQAAATVSTDDGRHDFDFFFGSWKQHNRKRVKPLVEGDDEWVEFESESEARPILGGLGNVDTYKAPSFPGRPGFEGFSLRLFEPSTGLWRIWWASTIGDGELTPPVIGRFGDGFGLFECDEVIEGVAVQDSLQLEGHHARRRHVGAVVLLRRRRDLGHELDHPTHSEEALGSQLDLSADRQPADCPTELVRGAGERLLDLGAPLAEVLPALVVHGDDRARPDQTAELDGLLGRERVVHGPCDREADCADVEEHRIHLQPVRDLTDAVVQHRVAGDPEHAVLLTLPSSSANPTTSPAIGRLSRCPWRHGVAVISIEGRPGASSRVEAQGSSPRARRRAALPPRRSKPRRRPGELLPAGVVVTTASGARRLGGATRGLEPWASTTLEAPGRPSIEITATPCRHGPRLSHPIAGDVIGFALKWEGQEHGVFWISGDTVLYGGVREVAERLDVDTVLLHVGAVRFTVTGPVHYTLTAEEAVELCSMVRPHTIVPVHYEGWKHFSQGRAEVEEAFARAPDELRRALRWLPIGEEVELD